MGRGRRAIDCRVCSMPIDRHRRRIVLRGRAGRRRLSARPAARRRVLRDGDGLVLDDGGVVRGAGSARAAARDRSARRCAIGLRDSPGISATATADVQIVGRPAAHPRAITCWRRCCEGWARTSTPIEAPFDPGGAAPMPAAAHPTRRMRTTDARGERPPRSLYRLMAWLSPAYPVGAFSYSQRHRMGGRGGDITRCRDAAQLARRRCCADGAGFCDAVLLRARPSRARTATTRRCARSPNLPPRFAPSKERHLETTAQGAPSSTRRAPPGRATRSTARRSGTARSPIRSRSASPRRPRHRARAGAAGLPARLRRQLVSAGVRLIPLGQTDGQRVLAALEPRRGCDGAGARHAARRDRRRDLSRRSRQPCATKPSTRGCSAS